MIPEAITIGGKTGTVVYLDAQWHPVPAEKATAARVLFDDGSTAFFTAEAPTQKREYVRDEKGQFAETGKQLQGDEDDPVEVYHGTTEPRLAEILRQGLLTGHAGEVWPTFSQRDSVYMTTDEDDALSWAERAVEQAKHGQPETPPDIVILKIRIPKEYLSVLQQDAHFRDVAGSPARQFKGNIPPSWIVEAKVGTPSDEDVWTSDYKWKKVKVQKAEGDQIIYVALVLHSSAAKREYVRDDHGRFAETGGWPLADDAPRTYTPGEANAIDHVYEPWAQGLTKEERGAIERYTASGEWGPSGHRVMNGVLQGRYDAKAKTNPDLARIKAEAEQQAAVIMGAIAKAPAPPPPDLVWRGVTGDISRLIPDLTPGTEVALKGFQSTTVDPKVAQGFGDTLLEITPTAGAYVSGEQLVKFFPQGEEHMHGGGEQELLLPHNARYRVRGVVTVLVEGVSKRVVQLEMLT